MLSTSLINIFDGLPDWMDGAFFIRCAIAGVTPLPAAKVLNQILLNELHDQLHWLITDPARFSHYRDLWNRFCDQQGAPDQKIPAPQQPTEGEGGEGPF